MKTIHFIFLLAALTIAGSSIGQTDSTRNFHAISRSMNQYFERVGTTNSEYKRFKRWEWYYSTRHGEGGMMVDNAGKNLQAYLGSSVNRALNSGRPLVNTGGWTAVGPTAVTNGNKGIGRVNRIAFHPTNANIMYLAGATGGLWITPDNGANWYSYTEGIPNMSLTGVVVHPTTPSIIYILTGDGDNGGSSGTLSYAKNSTGVLKSYDGGFTWYHTSLKWPETDNMLGYKLMMHPSNPEVLLVATNHGIFRTTDGFNSFTQLESNIEFYDIEFHPSNPSIIYACGNHSTESRVYRSTDDGQTFTETFDLSKVGNGLNRMEMAVTPANTSVVYLFAGPHVGTGAFRGLYRSTDAGLTFTLRTSTPNILGRSSTGDDDADQSGYDLALAASPTNSNVITTGGIRIWTSSNGGTSLTYQDNYVSTFSHYHDDIHHLTYHPLRSNELYMCADGGVYRSTDNGDNWIALNNNLPLTQYYRIAPNPASGFGFENIMIGGTQDNGTNKRGSSGGGSFEQIIGADGMDCFIDPDGVTRYLAGTQDGKFYFSINSGDDFELIGNGESIGNALGIPVRSRWLTPAAEITGTTTSFLLGYNPVIKVTRILANSYGFDAIGDRSNLNNVSGRTLLKTARGNANRIYAGDNNTTGASSSPFYRTIYTTTNQGDDWTVIYDQTDGVPFTDLAFNADNGNELWITFGGYQADRKVLYSNDGGGTWTNITGSLPDVPVNCIVFDDNNGSPGGAVYIGTDIGVFYRDHTLGDWVPFSNGLPVVEITDLELHETEGLLRAGTYGRGIWETSLYSACPSSISLTTSNTQHYRPYYFQASNNIVSEAHHFGTGAFVYYKAGETVTLTPGFHVQAAPDNEFEVVIGPCGGGVPGGRPGNTLRGHIVQ